MPRPLTLLGSLILATVIFAGLAEQMAQAQTFTVIHNFTGYDDGSIPATGTLDAAGNFYGTTYAGGTHQPTCNTYCGTVFKLSENNGVWILSTLYNFSGQAFEGAAPQQGVIFGPDGALYGTTEYGGCPTCAGTVFKLAPPGAGCLNGECNWLETTLHDFSGFSDGGLPSSGVVFDSAGTRYGTTSAGGANNVGTVYELSPAGVLWNETVLYTFMGGADGGSPQQGVVFNNAGDFFGTCCIFDQNNPNGAVYELTPTGSGYSKSFIYNFSGGLDGSNPLGLIIDSSGKLYGTTEGGGTGAGGTVYELLPQNGGWSFALLYALPGSVGPGSEARLTMDAAGNLYGTTYYGGQDGYGSVFKLTPTMGSWTYTSLHAFTGELDGRYPGSSVVLDSQGNVYGTALAGGAYGLGVAFKIEQ